MKKTLRKRSKSPIAKVKAKIQTCLTERVRIRDGGCIFRNYPETGRCGGVTAADHIITRQIASTYGDLRNTVCSCWAHHKFFKEKNPTIYAKIVEKHIGARTYNLIHKIAGQSEPKSLKEWEKALEKLTEVGI